jgi:hypothetical protein
MYYHVLNSPQLYHILSQKNVVNIRPYLVLLKIVYHLRLGLPSDLFQSCFPAKIFSKFLISTFTFLQLSRIPGFTGFNKIWKGMQIVETLIPTPTPNGLVGTVSKLTAGHEYLLCGQWFVKSVAEAWVEIILSCRS